MIMTMSCTALALVVQFVLMMDQLGKARTLARTEAPELLAGLALVDVHREPRVHRRLRLDLDQRLRRAHRRGRTLS